MGGSTSSFDLPQSEVQKYEQQHSQGSNGASAEEEEPGRDESLVHVSSPKVRGLPESQSCHAPSSWVHAWAGFSLLLALHRPLAWELHCG